MVLNSAPPLFHSERGGVGAELGAEFAVGAPWSSLWRQKPLREPLRCLWLGHAKRV